MLTEIHDVVSADSTVVDDDVPRPQGNGIPLDRACQTVPGSHDAGLPHLLDLESLLAVLADRISRRSALLLSDRTGGSGGVCHVDVGHVG